jgi:hypothetical protein
VRAKTLGGYGASLKYHPIVEPEPEPFSHKMKLLRACLTPWLLKTIVKSLMILES